MAEEHLPEAHAPLATDWWWMAALLATLRVASVVLGAVLVWWLLTVFYTELLPAAGFGWLGALEAIAAMAWPERLLGALIGGAG